jgi:cellulose synthase (UDP-forming)
VFFAPYNTKLWGHPPTLLDHSWTSLRSGSLLLPHSNDGPEPLMHDVTVVVPTFNEGGNVPEMVRRLGDAFTDYTAEILFVDDSTDDTPDIIWAAAEHSRLPVHLLHRDEAAGGLAGAVTDGIRQARGSYVVVMDGDLQHPPEMAPALVDAAVAEGADMVVASRYIAAGDAVGLRSGLRRTVSGATTRLAQTAFPRRVGRLCTDPMTGFFCFRRPAVDLERLRPRGFKILLEILARHDLYVTEVPFVFGERAAGQSKASWRNGMQFLYQLVTLRLGPMLGFAVVGALGTLVNLLLMTLLMIVGAHYVLAAVVSSEVAIAHNFLLLERFVFADRRDGHHSRAGRAWRFVAANNIETLIRLLVLVGLVGTLELPPVRAQALTLLTAFFLRFTFVHKVVYRPKENPATAPAQALAIPPTDAEKYNYVKGPQHRWFFWAHFVSFCGIAYSLYGFARMQYWTLIFLLPLSIYAAETLLGLWTSTFRRRISMTEHAAVVELWAPERHPSVDVFIPTAGEDLEILENTYRYVALIDYPGEVSVHVLDDFARPEVRAAADRYGFNYLARPGNAFKKAGNLQWAYERTHGDHILILDADFAPRNDVLNEVVPYMDDDPRIGIIQTPQYYPSHTKGMGWIERCASATQELFYRFIQPSRDAVEATICCGTSALYRRKALDALGGFPQISHSEDVFTGFNMIEHGYRTAFVPVNVTQGLCPAEIDPYISQQYRWCEGSMELLKMPEFHLHPSLTIKQRASFWSGFFYYITTAMNGFLAPLPLLIIVWLFPALVRTENFVPLVGLLVLWLVAYPMLMNTSWRVDVVRVQVVYGFTHAVAIYDMFFGQKAEWIPSNGANRATPLAVKVKRIMGWYLVASLLVILAGVSYRLSQPQYTLGNWWALLAFMSVNLYVFLPVVYRCFSTLFSDWRAARGPQRDFVIDLTTPFPIVAIPAEPAEALRPGKVPPGNASRQESGSATQPQLAPLDGEIR